MALRSTSHIAAPFGGVQRRACSGAAVLHADSITTEIGTTTTMRQTLTR